MNDKLKEALVNRDLADTRRNQQRVIYDRAMEASRLAQIAWSVECQIWDESYREVTRIRKLIANEL